MKGQGEDPISLCRDLKNLLEEEAQSLWRILDGDLKDAYKQVLQMEIEEIILVEKALLKLAQ